MLTPEELTQVVQRLDKASKYNRGAWASAIEAGRAYAQLKAFGTRQDGDRTIHIAPSVREEYLGQAAASVLQLIEQAFAEDAQLGAEVSRTLS